jgi:type I restriction enzyme S subunit
VKAGWTTKPLSEVCTFKPQKSEARAKLASEDEVSFVPMENLGIGSKELTLTGTRSLAEVAGSYTYFAEGDVLLAKITPCFENGKLGIARNLVNGIGFGSSEYIVIRPSPEVDADFLYHFLDRETFREEGAKQMTGAVGHKRVPKEYVEGALIPVPTIEEQLRIVTLLDEAFADIATAKANAEKNLQNARELFESHLDEVLGSQASDHIATTLGTEVDLVAGFAFSSSRYSNNENDIRLLRGDNIMQGYLRWEDVKRWPMSDRAAHGKFALKEGDVVLAMDRPWVKAGLKRAQMTATDLPCLQVQRTARLRTKQNLSADFLFHLTGSQAFSRHLLDVQTGIGVPHISGAQIQDFKFMRPPLAKQAMIATELQKLQEETQRLETIYRQKLTAFDDLKKSLLHQAFSGQL